MPRRTSYKNLFCIAIGIALLSAAPLHAGEIHHEIKIDLDPETHRIAVEDTIHFSGNSPAAGENVLHFLLHPGLNPHSPNPEVSIFRIKSPTEFAADGLLTTPLIPARGLAVESYRLTLPRGQTTAVLRYSGEIDHPLRQEDGEASADFPGTVSEDGIYLEGTSYWVPWFDEGLVTFTLDVTLPAGWDAVSQGQRTRHEKGKDKTIVRWESPEAQDAIYLVGGIFSEYGPSEGKVSALAFLRTPDAALAEQYLGVTGQYIEMYEGLIGPYPYTKFALVENFWDTGYGMPSFTLLGPTVIRFAFILHSSYPHEILHNWWGNGVYVDSATGNWSEGLTAYLADHLIQEQRGRGTDHRRAVLQKYSDYVSTTPENGEKSRATDLPLTDFRERHNPVTEAVGYGKTLMFFHMLRQTLGDEVFIQSLRDFYKNFKFKRAGFSDLQTTFSQVSKRALEKEFEQWVRRTGAPARPPFGWRERGPRPSKPVTV